MHVIRRSRILRALDGLSGVPVRILCAPIGSGVTIALRDYEATRPGCRYVAPAPDGGALTPAALRDACRGAREVLIDDADRLSRCSYDTLLDLAQRTRAPRIVLAGHARSRLRVHALVAGGDAELVDASALAFDAGETEALAAVLGVRSDRDDVAEVLYQTDGWALALSWLMRDAARQGRALCGAFEIWAESQGHLLREFVDAAAGEDGIHDAQSFERICAAASFDDEDAQAALRRLDALGYPIVRTRQGLRPYRTLAHLAAQPREPLRAPHDDRLALTLLGRFSAQVGEREIAFVRRRDRTVLMYLALSPQGRVSRSELAAIFWPNVPAAISSQGIRTTLSRLRHAIADASGRDADHYLRCGAIVALDLANVVVDARRFLDHVARAQSAEERGDAADAWHHYLFAHRFRATELLRSEPVDASLEPLVTHFAELAQRVGDRVAGVGPVGAGAPYRSDGAAWRLHGATA